MTISSYSALFKVVVLTCTCAPLVALSGCLITQPMGTHSHHKRKDQPPPTILVGGLTAEPGRQVIPAGGLTLRDAITIAGGDIPERKFSMPAPAVIVSLEREGKNQHFSLPLVTDNIAGMIRLLPNDRIILRPWKETDLAKAVEVTEDLVKTKDDTMPFNKAIAYNVQPKVQIWKQFLGNDPGGPDSLVYEVPFSIMGQTQETQTIHVSSQKDKLTTDDSDLAAYVVSPKEKGNPNALLVNAYYMVDPNSSNIADTFSNANSNLDLKEALKKRLKNIANNSTIYRAELASLVNMRFKSIEDFNKYAFELAKKDKSFDSPTAGDSETISGAADLIANKTVVLKRITERNHAQFANKATLKTFSDMVGDEPKQYSQVMTIRRPVGVGYEEYVLMRPTNKDPALAAKVLADTFVIPGDSVAAENLLRLPVLTTSLAAPGLFDPAMKDRKKPHHPILKKSLDHAKETVQPFVDGINGLGSQILPNQ